MFSEENIRKALAAENVPVVDIENAIIKLKEQAKEDAIIGTNLKNILPGLK